MEMMEIIGWTLAIMYMILPFFVVGILVVVQNQSQDIRKLARIAETQLAELARLADANERLFSQVDATNQILVTAHEIEIEE